MRSIFLATVFARVCTGCGDERVDPDQYLVEYRIGLQSMAVDPAVDASAPLVVRP